MEGNTRRNFFGKLTAMMALLTGAPKLIAQQAVPAGAPTAGSAGVTGGDAARRAGGNHTLNGVYYFSVDPAALTTCAVPTISISESPGIHSTAKHARDGALPGEKYVP